jgi:hypothetical protein
MSDIVYPFGDADSRTITTATTIAVDVTDQMTLLKLSANLTAATTINITPSSGVRNGAQLFIEIACATAYDVTFGSAYVTSAGVTGTTNKTKVASFVFYGGKFVQVGVNTIN